ncbi:MAG: AlkZ family DNA glycosylase [Solirubrobacterales bacterium]|nr:AlkZ family DNA glycosylase [Solirubrobacterales bacterium]
MDLTSRRLLAQGLIDSELRDPVAVTGRLLAIQAQDPRGARLAVRSRLADSVEGPVASAVDEALNDRSLVIGWLNRGTLHLVRTEDYRWLAELTSPRLITSNRTRLGQEGVSAEQADRAVELIRAHLADGPATRTEIKELLESADIPVAGQALVHILFLASLQGHILRGPMKGREQAFVLAHDWLGEQRVPEQEAALAELARRYLAGHGPATDRDLSKWAGIALGQARKGLARIASELTEADGLVDLADRPAPEGEAPTRLLGSFDPILHGWESREWIIPGEEDRAVVTTNGIFRPTLMVEGRISGTWTMPKGVVETAPFESLDPAVAESLDRDAADVARYLAG